MRVAFDVTATVTGNTGIAAYATELPAALERRGVDVVRFAFGRGDHRPPTGTRHRRVPLRILQPLWARWGWPRAEQVTGAVDLVHAAGPVPVPSRRPVVVTVHDLAPLEHPDLHDPRKVADARRTLEVARSAAAVVTVSRASAAALVRHGVPEARITVTPNGLRELPDPDGSRAPTGRFVLSVGQLAPRKRLTDLVDVLPALPADVDLVLCGPDAGDGAAVRARAARLDRPERVVLPGFVPDAELAGLLDAATVVACPSADEGFGLPLLEAMARGRAVVASDLPAHREVAGGAAELVPPGDLAALGATLARVLDDDAGRERMGAAGRARAAGQTWDACAATTIAVYEALG